MPECAREDPFNDQLVRGAAVDPDSDRLASNLSFMAAVPEARGLEGACANARPVVVALASTYLYY